MKRTSMSGSLMLLLTATIWGVAFVAQRVGMDYVGPFTFSSVRCLLGGIVLLPVIALIDRMKNRRAARENPGADPSGSGGIWGLNRTLLTGGVLCGIALCVAGNLQQVGIQYTTVGKAGFITAMYIVLVPVFGVFLKKRIGLRVWISVALSVAGLYLLCITESFSIGFGDFLMLLCAAAFAVQILIIDRFSPVVDGVRMACIQFFVCGILSGICMLIFEQPSWHAILQAWLPIGYAGVLSCGVAYTLQIVVQKEMDPTVASLIMSVESVVSLLAGWVLLGQRLSVRELFGCVLMFAAILLAQLPLERMVRRKR